jgi:hypothetical protein
MLTRVAPDGPEASITVPGQRGVLAVHATENSYRVLSWGVAGRGALRVQDVAMDDLAPVHDVASGSPSEHKYIRAARFETDSCIILAADGDRRLRLIRWFIGSNSVREVASLPGLVSKAEFSPDCSKILVIGSTREPPTVHAVPGPSASGAGDSE